MIFKIQVISLFVLSNSPKNEHQYTAGVKGFLCTCIILFCSHTCDRTYTQNKSDCFILVIYSKKKKKKEREELPMLTNG